MEEQNFDISMLINIMVDGLIEQLYNENLISTEQFETINLTFLGKNSPTSKVEG